MGCSGKYLTESEKKRIEQLRLQGMKIQDICRYQGVSTSTVYKIVKNTVDKKM